MIANVHALSGRYDEALVSYKAAVELAHSACIQEPNNRECQVRSIDAQAHQVYFLLAMDNAAGRLALLGLKQSMENILSQGAIEFTEHLILGFALCVEGAYALSKNDYAVAVPCYEKAWGMLEAIKELTPPDTRQAAQFNYTLAIVTVQRGVVRCIQGQSNEEKQQGLVWMQDGINLLDQMLLINPKAFPYRLQKIQTYRGRANIHRFLKENEKAIESDKIAMELTGALAKENPNLAWLSGFDSLQQTMKWVDELRTGNFDAFESNAEAFLTMATPSLRGEVKYNVVCGYALVAAQVEEMREAYAAKAVSLLNELKDVGFFSIKARLDHLGVDNDLDPLRERDDFKAFLESTKKPSEEYDEPLNRNQN
jgi:tetratricopeptide (TPR) repeat protein